MDGSVVRDSGRVGRSPPLGGISDVFFLKADDPPAGRSAPRTEQGSQSRVQVLWAIDAYCIFHSVNAQTVCMSVTDVVHHTSHHIYTARTFSVGHPLFTGLHTCTSIQQDLSSRVGVPSFDLLSHQRHGLPGFSGVVSRRLAALRAFSCCILVPGSLVRQC